MENVIKAHPNFTFYQTHVYKGKVITNGIMGNEKNDYIDLKDIKRKRVLDLGCATGATSIWAFENGAKEVIGIDSGVEQIQIFSELTSIIDKKHKKINSCLADLSKEYNILTASPSLFRKIDTIFCFAIMQYIGYRKIWHDVPSAKVICIMGGADSNFTEENLSDDKYTAKFITDLPNNTTDIRRMRKFFKLTKNR